MTIETTPALARETTVGAPARRGLPASWPLIVLFAGLPVWWALGATAFVWPGVGLLLIVHLLRLPDMKVPRGFGLWMLFLAFVLLSATQVNGVERWLAFAYRGSLYVAATALFLYIFNTPSTVLPSRVIVRWVTVAWIVVVVGGVAAVFFPAVRLTSPVEALLPQSLLQNGLVRELVHPELAQESRVLGYPVGRPNAPFPFTNAWGSNLALLTPFVFLSWRDSSTRWRHATTALLVVSVVPMVLSLNRGLWLSLGAGLLFAIVRAVMSGRSRTALRVVGIVAVVLAILAATPLRGVVLDRSEHAHSDEGRLFLYTEAVALTIESPVIGHGTPQPARGEVGESGHPSVGTHGQIWLVLVSQGVIGALVFVGWYLVALARIGAGRTDLGLWCQVVLAIAAVQLLFYEHLPTQLHIVMVASALILREGRGRTGHRAPGDLLEKVA